ncbi:hypothetical protein H0H93_009027 [Arthromyces matolae]|nr:hypothetical protein H0H93_009027 [Arthromyces matolae]
MPAEYSEEDSQLIAGLHKLSKKSPKLVRSSVFKAPADPTIEVRSWKMNEFKYYDIPSPFPTLARGLFSVELPKENEDLQKYRIVARGYDKFFNIGEVPWTTWSSIESHTASPYTLSLKSNGCIIFIAALTPSKLLVTSKHSLGPVSGVKQSHAEAGEAWLRKYLQQKGRTESDLAKRLWENNWTAVAELCDDSFEEHVLAYPPEKTGLHLHGLNVATKAFVTLPQSEVDAFADEWGFIKTASIEIKTVAGVRAFTQEVSELGEWNGEAVEGFVVRTHVTEPPTGKGKAVSASPYAPGSSFFFKVKFDEPYMMYRDWREVTKKLLAVKEKLDASSVSKSKMQRAETRAYVRWVIEEITRDRSQFAEYNKGKGIIATRERFLQYLETPDGKAAMEKAKKGGKNSITIKTEEKSFQKTIIAPVAIPGCGKTAVAVALAHIFGFGHTQSDDVLVKKPAPQFLKNVQELLRVKDVVIADKNNHLAQHRKALRDLANGFNVPTRLLVLNWGVGSIPQATVHRVCGDRIMQRGENHQTLRPDAAKGHEEVIWMFLNTRQEFSDSEADAVIEMEVEENIQAAVRRAVNGCVAVLGLEQPTEEKIGEALAAITSYKPHVKTGDDEKKKKTKDGSRYYGLLAEVDLEEELGTRLASIANASGVEGDAVSFWGVVKGAGRVTQRPHVTIVHRNSLPAEKDVWDNCAAIHMMENPPLFKLKLGHLVWNARVMALTVDKLVVVEEEGYDGEEATGKGKKFLDSLSEDLMRRLHITVGTKNAQIKAVEAKSLIETYRKGESSDASGPIRSISLDDIVVSGRIKEMLRRNSATDTSLFAAGDKERDGNDGTPAWSSSSIRTPVKNVFNNIAFCLSPHFHLTVFTLAPTTRLQQSHADAALTANAVQTNSTRSWDSSDDNIPTAPTTRKTPLINRMSANIAIKTQASPAHAPLVGPGRLTQLKKGAKRYCSSKSIPAAEQVAKIINNFKDDTVSAWILVNEAELITLSLKDFFTRLRSKFLSNKWHLEYSKVLYAPQGDRPFSVYCKAVWEANNLLAPKTDIHMNNGCLCALMRANMCEELSASYNVMNGNTPGTLDNIKNIDTWQTSVTRIDKDNCIKHKHEHKIFLKELAKATVKATSEAYGLTRD